MEPGIPTIGALRARCSFSFTRELFLEYSRICDFMSKWKKWFAQSIVILYVILFFLLLVMLMGAPAWTSLFVSWLPILLALSFVVALITQSPPLWPWKRKQRGIMRMYAERLGFDEPGSDGHCITWFEDGFLGMESEVAMMEVPIDDVRWVRQSGDLVIVGCLSGAKSFVSPIFSREVQHYKAVPAAAFLKTKLEGMDPDELVEALQPYVRQHRRDYFAKLRFWERWHAEDEVDGQ